MSLRSFFRSIDPTRAGSVVRRGLRQLDPTLKSSVVAGGLRQLDVTNKNSLAGKVAPYAVGLIPGIGAPLALGLGAGIGAAQGIGRGEDLGGVASSALGGASKAGIARAASGALRGIGQAISGGGVPAAPTIDLSGAGDAAMKASGALPTVASTTSAPIDYGMGAYAGSPMTPAPAPIPSAPTIDLSGAGSAAMRDAASSPISLPSLPASGAFDATSGLAPSQGLTSASRPYLANLGGDLAGATKAAPPVTDTLGLRKSPLKAIGNALSSGLKTAGSLAPLISAGAQTYGAYQLGQAEDQRLAMEKEQFDTEQAKQKNRIGFSAWKRRRGVTPTA